MIRFGPLHSGAFPPLQRVPHPQFLILGDGDGEHTAHQLFFIRSFKVNPPQVPHSGPNMENWDPLSLNF